MTEIMANWMLANGRVPRHVAERELEHLRALREAAGAVPRRRSPLAALRALVARVRPGAVPATAPCTAACAA